MNINDIIEGTIDSLAFGGKGILKEEGQVVFIPFCAPGDRVRCRITKVKKNHAEAEIIAILQEGPGRTTPPCPYYGACGGCQLQHMNYASQLSYKEKSVVDALERIGKITLDSPPAMVPATAIWEYRRHITLSIIPSEGQTEVGYKGTDSYSLIPIKQCQLFAPQEAPLFTELSHVISNLDIEFPGRVTLMKAQDSKFLAYFSFPHIPKNALAVITYAQKRWPQWAGIAVTSPAKMVSAGSIANQIHIDDLTFTFSPAAFIQNHPEQSLNIYRDILRMAKQRRPARILDLYCGIGISTLLLAQQTEQVVGIEGNAQAIEMAKANSKNNGIANCDFFLSDVKKALLKALKEFKPELIVVNPPRTGLDAEVIRLLQQWEGGTIFYISCMPPTLARDLQWLVKAGYKVASCRLYDMFPQTSHVETLVELTRN